MPRATYLSLLLWVCCAAGALARESPKQFAKTLEGPADLPREVLSFYNHLLDTDAEVQAQVARLTARSREKNGGLFKKWDEPRAFEYLPYSGSSSNSGEKIRCHYLVVQLAGRWRTKDSDADLALVSEFEVILDEPEGKLALTFLGFRNLSIAAIPPAK